MVWGNKPTDDGNFFFDTEERHKLINEEPDTSKFIRPYYGSAEFIRGIQRYALWIEDSEVSEVCKFPEIKRRLEAIKVFRGNSKAAETRPAAEFPAQSSANPGCCQNFDDCSTG